MLNTTASQLSDDSATDRFNATKLAIPDTFQPLTSDVVSSIIECLHELKTPRFIALYVISFGAIAINDGCGVMTLKHTNLQQCITKTIQKTPHSDHSWVLVIDRQDSLAWAAVYGMAAKFLRAANASPDRRLTLPAVRLIQTEAHLFER